MSEIPNKIHIRSNMSINSEEIQFSFARSSGPGGQKVNKTNSQAILKWNFTECSTINDRTKARIQEKLSNRINKVGELVIQSDQYRDQKMNIMDCLDRFVEMLKDATHIPKYRKATKPSKASKERRLQDKKRQSDKKRMRKIDY